MSAALSQLASQALELSVRERADLADLLLESIEDETGTSEAVLAEMRQRAEELKSGKVTGLTTKEAYGFEV